MPANARAFAAAGTSLGFVKNSLALQCYDANASVAARVTTGLWNFRRPLSLRYRDRVN
jgi:hypothetical protein